jgi:hypothetical protein
MRKARLLGLGVALVLAGAAFSFVLWQGAGRNGASVALAQGVSTGTPTAPTNATPPAQGAWTDMANAFWSALASKLGITAESLKSDVVAAEKDVIEQAVTSGKLTRAQADQIEQRLTTNAPLVPFFGGMPGGPGGPGRGNNGFPGGPIGGVDTLEAVANALDMKVADLSAELQGGKSLADIATAQNVDQAKVKQAIIDSAKVQIQREVQDGLITQAQADQRLANLTPDKIDLTRSPWLDGPRRGQFPQRGNPQGGNF